MNVVVAYKHNKVFKLINMLYMRVHEREWCPSPREVVKT